jgi:site-specific DNA recombinase
MSQTSQPAPAGVRVTAQAAEARLVPLLLVMTWAAVTVTVTEPGVRSRIASAVTVATAAWRAAVRWARTPRSSAAWARAGSSEAAAIGCSAASHAAGGCSQDQESQAAVKPCYGYQARRVPHPVPAERAKGVHKTRLEPHPDEAPVVGRMFAWRVTERLGYQAIADRLNADLALSPPPTPVDPGRSIGRWTYSNVRDVLTNPKHTGHMVWNRRARKGAGKNKMNPVTDWVWSPEPVHEALVDLETFVQAQEVSRRRERSRTAPGLSPDPQAKRVYPLRSHVFCDLCGRRMFGNTKRDVASYACAPKKAWRPDGHPFILRVREDHLLGGLTRFLDDNVFGPYRHALLDASHTALAEAAAREHATRIKALNGAIADTDVKTSRLIRTLEITDDIDHDFISGIKQRRAELRAQREDQERQLDQAQQQGQDIRNPALLDHLPVSAVDLAGMPDEASRRLFEALRLEIRYDPATREARCSITLAGDTIDAVSRATREVMTASNPATEAISTRHAGETAHIGEGLRSAPRRIRTFAPGSGGFRAALRC